ncbi:MAG TPA: EAL domain-containing protein, partial [Rhodopila sp.]|nr:EAL domain-containing protein [Rhodopila sp.]
RANRAATIRRSIAPLARAFGACLPTFKAESLRPELLAIGCFLLLPWIGITVALEHEYHRARAEALQSTANLAQALEESTRRTIGQIDYILLSARAMRAAQGERFDFNQWVRTQTVADKMTVQIAIADRTGIVVDSTVPMSSKISVGDRPHFLAQLEPSRDDLFISQPLIGRVSGLEIIQFSRKLLDPDGAFAGVVVLSLGTTELSRFYEALKLGNGFVSIVSNDGIILARGPRIEGLNGTRVTRKSSADGMLERAAGSVELPATAYRGPQIASFRHLRDYPLIVMVGLDTDTVFEPYRSLRLNALLSGAAITLAVGLIGFFWVRQKQRSLASRRALAVTLDTISQGILMVDGQNQVSVINPRVLDLLARPEDSPDTAIQHVVSRARELAASQGASASTTAEPTAERRQEGRFETALDNGTIIEVRTHALQDCGFVQTYTDVTEQRLAHAQVLHLAHHDPLTGLANRAALMQRLSAIVDQFADSDVLSALIMIDLDGFKGVNDTFGHDAGDALLIEVAQRLKAMIRTTDVVARLGGDEFVMLLPELRQGNDIIMLAERVLRGLSEPVQIHGQGVRIGASLGIAFHPQDGLDVDTWLKHADMALYSAKHGGRGTYRCFDQQLFQAVTEHHLLEIELRQALVGEGLEVHFQPKFACGSLEITGFEALARWRHPSRGYISPAVFIRIAEDCGLIGRLGRWVLENACKNAAAWEPRYPVAVNVSVMQLHDNTLKDHIATVLRRTGLQPQDLEIEVTESVMADDDQVVLDNLRAIKAMGIKIALDDFGTGFSSLSYLRRFSFDKIKIDRSFVQGQADDPGVRVILEAILGMCHNLGLTTVGEGIETREQLDLLRNRGCTEVQGYLLGRPMPAKQIPAFIRGKLVLQAGDTSPGAEKEQALLVT